MEDKKIYMHLFQTLNSYYLYDTNANSIIKISEKVYNQLQEEKGFLVEDSQIFKLKERDFYSQL